MEESRRSQRAHGPVISLATASLMDGTEQYRSGYASSTPCGNPAIPASYVIGSCERPIPGESVTRHAMVFMGSKKKRKRDSAARAPRASLALQEAAESRTAVAATVAWMLTPFCTLIAEGIGLVCRLYATFVEPVDLLTVVSVVMLFVAMIAGLLTLGLIPVVLRVSKVRPPTAIVRLAIIAGSLPLGVVSAQYLFST